MFQNICCESWAAVFWRSSFSLTMNTKKVACMTFLRPAWWVRDLGGQVMWPLSETSPGSRFDLIETDIETWHGCSSVSSSLCSSVEIHISAHCADSSSCQTAAVSRCATEASWRAAISDPQVNKYRVAVSLTTHHWNVLTLWFARQNYGCISRLHLWVMTSCDVTSLFAQIKFRKITVVVESMFRWMCLYFISFKGRLWWTRTHNL